MFLEFLVFVKNGLILKINLCVCIEELDSLELEL